MSAIVSDANKVFTAAYNAAFYGNSFTVSGWYKLASTPADYAYLVGNADGTTDGWTLLSALGANTKELYRVNASTQYNVSSTTDRTANTWNFIALTFNSTTNELKGYWGNESTAPTQVASTTTTSGSMGSGGSLALAFGTSALDAAYRDQKISDIRIYNATVRSLADIQSDYNQRVTSGNGLTDYWKFNDGSGNTADNLVSARDATATAASWDNADDPAFVTASSTGAGFIFMNL